MSAMDEFLAMYGDDADHINDCRIELTQLRADLAAKDQRIAELAAYASSLENQLKMYQRMGALRQ